MQDMLLFSLRIQPISESILCFRARDLCRRQVAERSPLEQLDAALFPLFPFFLLAGVTTFTTAHVFNMITGFSCRERHMHRLELGRFSSDFTATERLLGNKYLKTWGSPLSAV